MRILRLFIFYCTILTCITLFLNVSHVRAESLFLEDWGITKNDVDSAYPDKNADITLAPAYYTPDGTNLPTFYAWGVNEDVAYNTSPTQIVGPGYGGQPFDLEAAYYGYDSHYFYIGFIGGVEPTGSKDPWRDTVYQIGDIFIDLDGDASGMTGWEYVLDLDQEDASTEPANMVYDLDGVGVQSTIWYQPLANPFAVVDSDIDTDPVTGNAFSVDDYISYQEYTNLPQYHANHNYQDYMLYQHYAFEAKIPFSEFTGDIIPFEGHEFPQTHLTMKCGNDVIMLGGYGVGPPVPEPASMLLIILGIIGIIGADVRRRIVAK